LAERPPQRLHLDPRGQGAGVHDGARRQERAADYTDRQQRKAGLVQMTGDRTMKVARQLTLWIAVVSLAAAVACGGKKPPVARPMPPPPPPPNSTSSSRPPAPPQPVSEPTIVPPEPVPDDAI